jgi:hypothetical protein
VVPQPWRPSLGDRDHELRGGLILVLPCVPPRVSGTLDKRFVIQCWLLVMSVLSWEGKLQDGPLNSSISVRTITHAFTSSSLQPVFLHQSRPAPMTTCSISHPHPPDIGIVRTQRNSKTQSSNTTPVPADRVSRY